jgi:hypothetical protein
VVKPEGPSAGLAATITANGIPVMGHLGLPPISIHAPGHSFSAAVNLPSNRPQDRTEGGYRTSVLSRPSQCVTVIVVTGQSVMPRLRRSR